MSEYTGGIDEEIGVEEKEKSDKITSIEEKKPKRRPFHYWEVGDRRLSLKLNTRMIENLVAGGDIPPLSVMITVVQAAAAPWTHKLKYEDVQKMYDNWTEDGGDQITFYTQIVMPTMVVSGFFPQDQADSIMKSLEEAEEMM